MPKSSFFFFFFMFSFHKGKCWDDLGGWGELLLHEFLSILLTFI